MLKHDQQTSMSESSFPSSTFSFERKQDERSIGKRRWQRKSYVTLSIIDDINLCIVLFLNQQTTQRSQCQKKTTTTTVKKKNFRFVCPSRLVGWEQRDKLKFSTSSFIFNIDTMFSSSVRYPLQSGYRRSWNRNNPMESIRSFYSSWERRFFRLTVSSNACDRLTTKVFCFFSLQQWSARWVNLSSFSIRCQIRGI